MRVQKNLGEILLEAGLIEDVHLQSALADQKRWGGRLGHHLIKAGVLTEAQLLDALSHQLGIAKINFRKSRIYKEALELVPKQICLKYNVVPVAVKQQKGHRKLLLAMADPTNYQAVQEVEFISGHSVVAVVGLESDIERAIGYCYHADGLRDSEGLKEVTNGIDFKEEQVKTGDEPVIYTQEGELQGLESRMSDISLRALVDLLAAKGVIGIDEYRRRIEELRKRD